MKKLVKKSSAKTIAAYWGCKCKTSLCKSRYYPYTKAAQLAAASKSTRF